jgi:N-acetyltransferase
VSGILSEVSGWSRLTERIEGELVVVEPLASAHEAGLFAAGQDRDVWRYLTAFPNACENPARFHHWMQEALTAAEEGAQGVWVILERGSGAPIGSTRYMALRPEHHGLELGWTWIGKRWWRTGANVETKLLLFGHAFDTLGCERVELKTDARNARSRAAMEALPAQFEGVHRRHMKVPDGWRDTAWYSVIAPEWPEVRAALRRRLTCYGRTAYAQQ